MVAHESLRVEIIKKQIIKPSSPTPTDLKSLKLSVLDQVAVDMYTPLLLFYPPHSVVSAADSVVDDNQKRCARLKTSLSNALAHFYPFAGKTTDNISIECNDDGVVFLEARANCLLSDILSRPNAGVLKEFLPAEIASTIVANGPVLLVQVTLFECGGMSVGVSISHKIADACSMTTFIKSWSKMASSANPDDDMILPHFLGASVYPPPADFTINIPAFPQDPNSVTTRIVFDAPKLAALRAEAVSESVQRPTRVEAVTALIWKCAMKASKLNSVTPKAMSILVQLINLRKRLVPPLPETSIGNLLGSAHAMTLLEKEKEDAGLQVLVGLLRDGIKQFIDDVEKNYGSSEAVTKMLGDIMNNADRKIHIREDVDFYMFSSWSRFDLYDADFGWGKPVWMSIASLSYPNMILLLDTRDGDGIEVWVTLRNQDEMSSFESNEELLQFASLNPSAI